MEHELEQEAHPDYIKGFNEGYLLRQHHPDLAASLSRSLEQVQSERIAGFKDGSLQYEKEKEQILSISWLEPLPDNYNDIIPDQDINKDDIDMEIEPE